MTHQPNTTPVTAGASTPTWGVSLAVDAAALVQRAAAASEFTLSGAEYEAALAPAVALLTGLDDSARREYIGAVRAGTPAAVALRMFKDRARASVWVLTWGGGDEPESPTITVHRTREGAIEHARNEVAAYYEDAEGLGRLIDTLRETGRIPFGDLPGDTWMSLDAADLGE